LNNWIAGSARRVATLRAKPCWQPQAARGRRLIRCAISESSSGKRATRWPKPPLPGAPASSSSPHHAACAAAGGVEFVQVTSSEEMRTAVLGRLAEATIVIKAAAVSDYRPKAPAAQKIKRREAIQLDLEPTGGYPG